MLKVKKLVDKAVVPEYATPGAAGMDLVATSVDYKVSGAYDVIQYVEYGTGLAFEIPEGYVGLLFPRSSVSNTDLMLANSVGVIDSDYRGEVKLRFREVGVLGSIYKVGDRVGQIVFVPSINLPVTVVGTLSDSARGEGGFGSTGA